MKKEYGATLSTYSSEPAVKKSKKKAEPNPFSKMGGKHTTQITKEFGKTPIFRGHITVKLETRLYAFNANDFLYSLAYQVVCRGRNMTVEEFGRMVEMSSDLLHLVADDKNIRGSHYIMDEEDGVYYPASEPNHFYAYDAPYYVMEHVNSGRGELVGISIGQFYSFVTDAMMTMSRVFSDFVGSLAMKELSSHRLAKNAENKVFKIEDQLKLKERYIKQLEHELADHKKALAQVHEVFVLAGNKDAVFVSQEKFADRAVVDGEVVQ